MITRMALSQPLIALGLVVSFGLPAVGLYRRRRLREPLDWARLRRMLLRNWAVLIGLMLLVVVAGRVQDVGFRIPSVGVFIDGLLFGFIAFAGTMLLVGLALRFSGGITADEASLVVFDQPLSRRIAIGITGAAVETILFFGFTIEALLALGTGPWIAGIAAAVGVLLMRAQWDTRNALQWLPGAVILSGITIWARTVLVVLLVRIVYDTITLASGDASDYTVNRET